MPDIKLSIVYLNFNRLAESTLTTQQLQQLCQNRSDIEIIAIDNGSSDGTADFLEQQANINSVLLPDNSGIAGYSEGFRQTRGQYILVLDDDSCPNTLTGIDLAIQRMDNTPNIGITACHIETPDGEQQWSWHLPKTKALGTSPFFIGCGFIIRRDIFELIDWYPEIFFLYQNEIDVSFKVRQLGYTIIYDPNCVVTHRGTPNQRPNWRRIFFPTRNTLWLIRQYYTGMQAFYMIISRLLIGLVRACSFGQLPAYFKAALAGLGEPVKKSPLSPELRKIFTPFWKQNSIIHQFFKRT